MAVAKRAKEELASREAALRTQLMQERDHQLQVASPYHPPQPPPPPSLPTAPTSYTLKPPPYSSHSAEMLRTDLAMLRPLGRCCPVTVTEVKL